MSYNFTNYGDFNNNNNNNNNLDDMDYLSLVKMLSEQIMPEKRKSILERLTEMNNQLLMGFTGIDNMSELPRTGMMSSRKKDLTENYHPSFDQYNYKGQNPVPFGLPVNSNGDHFDYRLNFDQIKTPNINNSNFKSNEYERNKIDDIDIDEIINDIHVETELDTLDKKLSKIKTLQNKIIFDKRKRKKEKMI